MDLVVQTLYMPPQLGRQLDGVEAKFNEIGRRPSKADIVRWSFTTGLAKLNAAQSSADRQAALETAPVIPGVKDTLLTVHLDPKMREDIRQFSVQMETSPSDLYNRMLATGLKSLSGELGRYPTAKKLVRVAKQLRDNPVSSAVRHRVINEVG
jgi:hypothetical protein